MNNETLAIRFQDLLIDGKWIANTNFREILGDIQLTEAQKKVGDLNTIEALVYHVSYYLNGILEAFDTGELTIRDAYSFDFNPCQTDQEWVQRKSAFEQTALRFIELVKTFPLDDLHRPFFKEEYGSLQRNLEAQLEHGYYHLGQLSLLLKLIRKK